MKGHEKLSKTSKIRYGFTNYQSLGLASAVKIKIKQDPEEKVKILNLSKIHPISIRNKKF